MSSNMHGYHKRLVWRPYTSDRVAAAHYLIAISERFAERTKRHYSSNKLPFMARALDAGTCVFADE